MFRKIIFIIIASNLQITAMQAPSAATPCPSSQLTLTHKIRESDQLYLALKSKYERKAVRQMLALAEQADTFSCVYRTLFHARCIDIANRRAARKKEDFDSSMRELLLNVGMLRTIQEKVKEYLDSYHAKWDPTTGINMAFIPGICALKFRKLHGKILTTMLEDDKRTLTVLHDKDALPSNPLQYSHQFIHNCGTPMLPLDQCKVKLDQSIELQYQLPKLSKPFRAAHFVCRFPCHAFLISLRTDENKKVWVYVIDSNNNNIGKKSEFKSIVGQFIKIAQDLNNKNNKASEDYCFEVLS